MTNLRVELAANLFTELATNNYRSDQSSACEPLKWIAQDCLAMADIFIEELNAEQTKS